MFGYKREMLRPRKVTEAGRQAEKKGLAAGAGRRAAGVPRRSAGAVVNRLMGDEAVMRRKLSAAGTGDPSPLVEKAKRHNKNTLFILCAGLLVSIPLAVQNASPPPLPDMTRNPYGGAVKKIETEVTAEYGGKSVKKDVLLGVLPAEADAEEIARSLDDLKARLPKLILGKNSSLSSIRSDLMLVEHDSESGADLMWASDSEHIVSADGSVNHIEGKKGDRVGLTANIRLGEASDRFEVDIVMGDPPEAYDFTDDIAESVDAAADELSAATDGSKVSLPGQTDGGVKLSWASPGQKTALLAPLLFLIAGIVIYRRRYAGIDRDIAAARESVERDFPDFLDKLLLLLNAGVVISSAIAKIAADYRERKASREAAGESASYASRERGLSFGRKLRETAGKQVRKRGRKRVRDFLRQSREDADESYFYEELCRMEDRIASSRVSLTSEFADLAVRSGRREVMRFSAILADNIDKGSALSEKLAQESAALWDMRKKSAEKKGRIAETKLTFPMVLQLVAIILITVAPAAIEMR